MDSHRGGDDGVTHCLSASGADCEGCHNAVSMIASSSANPCHPSQSAGKLLGKPE
jgi:hypothetical protein